VKTIAFNPGAISGFQQTYAMFISDSAAIPNPQLNIVSRVEYTDA